MKKTLLPLALGACMTISASAAVTLIGGAINNGDFSVPTYPFNDKDKENISTGHITSWATWTEAGPANNDTGTYYKNDTFGNVAYIQPNGAIRNMTTHTIAVGDTFNYGFTDVVGSRGDATMTLIYEDAGVYKAITGTDLVGNLNEDGHVYTKQYTVQEGDAWVGKTVGVGFKGHWPEIDNVTLDVPEPSSAALFGLAGLALILRRRK